MFDLIIKVFWLLLPAGFANMAPVLSQKVNFLDYPVDFNKKFRKKPLFGKNKTYRGFFFGILSAILIVYIQKLCYGSMQKYSMIDYSSVNIILLGFILGFGALFGDLIKSFFKRRLNIRSGETWFFFDHTDWIIGSLLFVNIFVKTPLAYVLVSLILFSIIHLITNYIGFMLKLKKYRF